MCGIIGVVSLKKPSLNIEYTNAMIKTLHHRGPDGSGSCFFHTGCRHTKRISFFKAYYKNINTNELHPHDWDLFFGHTRLSIQDLSINAHQPMSDLSQNIWITYNGEIYNFKELKAELQICGHRFKSNSDTEVIIYSYIEWGIECIKKFNGMFAFALYDNFKKELFLARDRYGIKPLYYTLNNDGTLLFASETKSILEYKDYSYEVDKAALVEYFTFQNIFTDKTLHENIKLLPAGNYIKINLREKEHSLKTQQYWDFDFTKPLNLKDEREYTEELDRLFTQAVNRQLVSDVEVGSYLSGGIDSGAITAIASKSIKNLKTFTVGFDLNSASGLELAYDERQKAEYMSYLFKTEHYEMVLKSGDMERCLSDFTYHLEEPRVGQSYPNYYAAKLASKFVKVVLAGTGGDELFAGYPWRYYRVINNVDFNEYIDKYYLFWQRLIPNRDIHNVFAPIWEDVKDVWTRDIFSDVFKKHSNRLTSPEDYVNHSLYFEAKTFLHGLLVVEDKLSMAHSLETRVPFLDNDLVDFSQQIPVNLKLSNLQNVVRLNENESGNKQNKYFQKSNDGKNILRKMANIHVPQKITTLTKQGFSSPDASWFKGESIEFVKKKLYNSDASIYKYLDKTSTKALIKEHLDGEQNRRLLIWSLINFEEWCGMYE
ncbi:MAG: asparagine synthase (glutamine-hydrolyzing) [Sulfurimonas denitrificans]|nr:asparagine synthase (glutamine-hydrolyzing) [Sulfurimonas denitrificans]